MSLDINYCRLCLQKIEGPAKTLSKDDSKTFIIITKLFPSMDTSLVINSKLCIECFKYVQFSNLMIETVTKNDQNRLLDLQNTLRTCRLCLNNAKLEVPVCLFKNTNAVIEMAIIDLDFDIFRKPDMCNSCWQIVKSIYLFKKKCFATEQILKYYCSTKKINPLNKTELEMVSLSYQDKLQQFSENLDEANVLFDRDARTISNLNLTQNIGTSQDMDLNNFAEVKDGVFKEVPFIADTLNVKAESLKEECKIEIKEEKLCDFNERDKHVDMATDTVNLESIVGIHQTELTSNASEILIIKTKNSLSQPGIHTKETIHDGNSELFSKCVNSTTRKRNLQSRMRSHDSEHKTHLSLKCKECPYETREGVNIELHLKAHQSKDKILKCPECYFLTTCSNFLKNHMETHQTKPDAFKCKTCYFVTKSRTDLEAHILIHQENYRYPCDKCSYQAKSKSNLVKHELVHQENYNFHCDKCSYQAKRKGQLVNHMLNHQENYNFHCQKCKFRTNRKSNLDSHMLVHQENYNFQCQICNFQTKRKTQLGRHMLVHQESYNFSCQKCDYQAKSKSRLVTHMSVHQENYKFKCEKCSYQAKRKDYLARHMLVHQDNYNFRCYNCSYQTKRKIDLINHMLIHQDTYNFQCPKCSYQAKSKPNLVNHMLVHEENFKFQCQRCNYQAKRKSHMVTHMLIHEGKCNFQCDECSYQAKRNYQLTRHMLKHHKGKKAS